MQYYPEFLDNLDALLVEEGPTLEELEIQAFGIPIQFATRVEMLIH